MAEVDAETCAVVLLTTRPRGSRLTFMYIHYAQRLEGRKRRRGDSAVESLSHRFRAVSCARGREGDLSSPERRGVRVRIFSGSPSGSAVLNCPPNHQSVDAVDRVLLLVVASAHTKPSNAQPDSLPAVPCHGPVLLSGPAPRGVRSNPACISGHVRFVSKMPDQLVRRPTTHRGRRILPRRPRPIYPK